MPTIDLGSVVGPQGQQGNTGPAGPQGVAGPSLISASTQTTLTGVLAGDGSTVGVRAVDATPTNNSTNLVSSGGVYTKITTDVANAYQRTSNPNLLDNWYFVGGGGDGVFPVNQRGQTNYPSTGAARYTIDRWKNNSWYCAVDLYTNYLKVTNTHSAGQTGCFAQTLKTSVTNRQCTLSALMSDGNLYSGTGLIASGQNLNVYLGDTQHYIYSTESYVSVTLPSNGSASFVAVKLEFGNQQTLCHNDGTDANPTWVLNEIPDFGAELAKCQRYFWNSGATASKIMSFVGVRGDGSAGTTMGALVNLPVPMRAEPTVDVTLHSIRGNGTNWNANLSSSTTPLLWSGSIVSFSATCSTASFPAYTNGYIVLVSHLTLSAEL